MDSKKTFRVYKLCPVSNNEVRRPTAPNSSVQLGEGKKSDALPKPGIESQLNNIQSTLQSLLEVSSAGISDSQQQANNYLKMLDAIREDESLPLFERNRLYRETHDKYLMFQRKADNEKAGQITKEVKLPEGYTGMRKPKEKILDKLTARQKEHGDELLDAFTNSGQLTWNERGEIVEPLTGKVHHGTDINALLKYDMAPAKKTNMQEPLGYSPYLIAKAKSLREQHTIQNEKQRGRARLRQADDDDYDDMPGLEDTPARKRVRSRDRARSRGRPQQKGHGLSDLGGGRRKKQKGKGYDSKGLMSLFS